MNLHHEAGYRLRLHRRSAAVIGISRWMTDALCVLSGCTAERMLRAADLPPLLRGICLPAAILTALTAVTPLRVQTDWQIGRLSGTLDENDLGFLGCSSSLWLWRRALRIRLLSRIWLLMTVLPMCLLLTAAGTVWAMIPPETESILPLLTVLHLLMLTAAAAYLPLRAAAAETALPFSFLKMPHETPLHILRMSYRLTRRQTLQILGSRLLMLPQMILPFTAAQAIPQMLCAEQMRSGRMWRRMQPHPLGIFSRLELHAAG